MIDLSLTFPLSLGLVAAFNPCGFAMLPAYLAYFVGSASADDTSRARSVVRAIKVSLALTAGFVAVFTVIGVLTETVLSVRWLNERLGWVTLAFGVLMVPLGIAMLLGREPKLALPRFEGGTKSTEIRSMFVFGVSYATISLSCTAPLFLAQIVGSFTRDSFVEGLAGFVAYAFGMGLVITVLTVGLAFARAEVATKMRRILPYVGRVSGAMLVLAGVSLAFYGWWEVRIQDDVTASDPVADTLLRGQTRISTWITDVGARQFTVALVFLLGGALVLALSPLITDAADRRLVRVGFVAAYALVELGAYRADLLLLPLLRTAADVPERARHWFTDPARWPVLFEVLAAGIAMALLAVVALRLARARRRSPEHRLSVG
jgi:cytochrome c biogenesis protein CcdA